MVLTLNQILKIIRDKALNHAQINSFYFGDPWEMGSGSKVTIYGNTEQSTPIYPLVGLTLLRTVKQEKLKSTVFNLWVCDQVFKGEGNETEVLSDTDLIISELHDQINTYLKYTQTTNVASLNQDFTYEDFTEKFDDEVSGHQGEITLTQFNSRDTCQIPTKT